MIIRRLWAMPSKDTFTIKPIGELIMRHTNGASLVVDPMARGSKIAHITNDLNPSFQTTHNIDALDFLKMFNDESVDVVLYDPPYSPRQITECYQSVGKAVSHVDTQSSFWGQHKKEISRILKVGGKCLSFGWNSGGIGKVNGMSIIEILIVPHGGWHNDTICTVEVKI